MTQFDKPGRANDACTHPKAKHQHGTYACYTGDGCRCDQCSPVAVAYTAWNNRMSVYRAANPGDERYQRYVDASSTRQHIEKLRAAGLGSKEIARRARVAKSVTAAILWETPARGRAQRTRVRPDVRDRILAVPIPQAEDMLDSHHVPALPSANRVKALHHLGYSQAMFAALADVDAQRVRRVVNFPEGDTSAGTHRVIAETFNRLRAIENEPVEHHSKIAAARARNLARREGWPTPIQLGRDGLVLADRASFDADVDRAAVKSSVDMDEFVFLVKCRKPVWEACALAGAASINHVALAARRAGRRDVITLLEEVAA